MPDKKTIDKNFHVKIEDGIAFLTFDIPNEKVNKLSEKVMQELDQQIADFSKYSNVNVLIIRSAKPGIFIAGADIKEIETITEPEDAKRKAALGQNIMNKIENLKIPTIAAIEGAALGGGLELALACDFRVASDNGRVQLGLPEVNLGIIPGFGGTQRLPRLIGLQASLPMILSGQVVDHVKGRKIGLLDAYFAAAFFDIELIKFAKQVKKPKIRAEILGKRRQFKGLNNRFLENSSIGQSLVFKKALENVLNQSKGNYPAPLKALEAVKTGYKTTLLRGLKIEAQLFSEVAGTEISKHLIHLFYVSEQLKKDTGVTQEETVPEMKHFGVLGAGLMGGGIAWLLSYRAGNVRIKDITWDAIAGGYKAASNIYTGLVKKRRLKPDQATMFMQRISAGTDFTSFDKADVVIEAIVENMDIKKKVFTELESKVSAQTIIASNTSGLSITEMASVLKHPERFIGMHFFSPVHKMPLVEIIRGEKTSDKTVASIVALTKSLKKTPIVVENCAGFLVNRILIPYVNEAVKLLEDGATVEDIDRVAVKFGMPLGPLALADEVGLDVGFKVAKQLEQAYGRRMHVAASFEAIHAQGTLLGKKSGKGFYVHDGAQKQVNSHLSLLIKKQSSSHKLSETEIEDRLFLIMLNEAARCLAEGVVKKAAYLDMAMIMGTGFPPFKGGLCRWADSRGLAKIENNLASLKSRFGDRFEVAEIISELARGNELFYTRFE